MLIDRSARRSREFASAKSTLSEPRNAWTNPAETEVLPRLSPGGPLCSQKSEPVYSFVCGRPERSSGDRQIILAGLPELMGTRGGVLLRCRW